MTPAISFSGEGSRGPLWKLILNREKTQTVRRPRKRPIHAGDLLKLYWKQRTPIDKKDIHLIGVAECTKVERLLYRQFAFDEGFARADGFENSSELRSWFGFVELHGNEEFDVLHFNLRGNQHETDSGG